jgi:hypothetical protein
MSQAPRGFVDSPPTPKSARRTCPRRRRPSLALKLIVLVAQGISTLIIKNGHQPLSQVSGCFASHSLRGAFKGPGAGLCRHAKKLCAFPDLIFGRPCAPFFRTTYLARFSLHSCCTTIIMSDRLLGSGSDVKKSCYPQCVYFNIICQFCRSTILNNANFDLHCV